jgi:hypothetical protein
MMKPSDMQVLPPTDWQKFERMMADLFEAEWGSRAYPNGRTGGRRELPRPACGDGGGGGRSHSASDRSIRRGATGPGPGWRPRQPSG